MIYTSLTLLHRFLESSTLLLMVLLLSFTAGTGGHGGAAEDFADVTLVHNADEKEEARELDEMLLEYGGQLTVQLNKKDTVVLREAGAASMEVTVQIHQRRSRWWNGRCCWKTF
uniref:Uncharacterized protein n=2 Tax=Populus alba TaxID=43335 RepID=A0A4U5PLI5_POPAL|nr:hypothetical protein D5086_0000216010 [Populus alba]